MNAGVFQGIRNVVLEDVADPAAGADDIVVAVRACGVCGSDLHTHGSFVEPGHVMARAKVPLQEVAGAFEVQLSRDESVNVLVEP